MTGRRAVAALLAAAAMAAAGCGDDSKADYVDEYNKVDSRFAPTLRRGVASIQSPAAGRDPSRLAPRLDSAAATFDESAKDFGAIDPPDDVKSTHDAYVAAIRTLADDFRKAADTLGQEKRPSRAAVRALRGLANSKGFRDLRASGEALRQRVNE